MFASSIIMRAIKSLPKTGWFNIMTATGTDYYTDVKLSPQADAIYTSGVIADAAYLAGGGTATDATLSKYDLDGNRLWQVVFGGALADTAVSLAVASDGSVYVTGLTNNAAVGADCYLAKFDGGGALQWAKSIGSTTATTDAAGSVAVCPDGNIVVTASLGNPAGVSVLKFDPSGTVLWKRHLATGAGYPAGILAAGTGDVYIATTALVASANYQVIAKYDGTGALQWQTRLTHPGSGSDRYALAEGMDGSIFIASRASATLGVIKFDTSGAVLWQTKTNASYSSYIGCAVDSAGNVFSSGYTGTVQYIIKQDANGARLWQRTVGSGYDTAVACLPSGDLLVAGSGNSSTANSIIMKYPASLPVGTFGGRVFADPTAITLTTGTQVQSASSLVESASVAVVQDATWIVAAYKTAPVATTIF